MRTVFYSWQSDLPNALNRGFLKDALERALRKLKGENPNEQAFELDSDTRGTSGSPHIAETILAKIDRAGVFVADVTPVLVDSNSSTDLPNPNVMFETGYATKALGPARVITILNEHFAPVGRLPFDLSHRRAITYTLSDSSQKKPIRDSLVESLALAIRAAMPPLVPLVGPNEADLPDPIEGSVIHWGIPTTHLAPQDLAWLAIAAEAFEAGAKPDRMLARTHRERLGHDFRPKTIRPVLLEDGRDITPVGLWQANSATPWLLRVDRLFRYLKQVLEWNPTLGEIRVSVLAKKLRLTPQDTSKAMHLLRTCHGWACSGSGGNPGEEYPPEMSVFQFRDPRVLNFYERFTTLSEVIHATLLESNPPSEF